MAIYNIYPEKDTFIYSKIPAGNAGRDEILEIVSTKDWYRDNYISRILIQFSTDEINQVISNSIGSKDFQADLQMYFASGQIPLDLYTLNAYPISGSWQNGLGKFEDLPDNVSGVSWKYRGEFLSSWISGTFAPNVTASYITEEGGGVYYTNYEATQSFDLNSNKDIRINVTPAIKAFTSGSIDNNGFIIKLKDSNENITGSDIILKYFGKDTNTIYPPALVMKWDDSTYDTGSLSELSTDIATIVIKNNKGEYKDYGKQRFRIQAKPKYPPRYFTTSSIYLTNYRLPINTQWGLQDERTNEMIIDFDSNYTKVSADNSGSFFDVYMGGLQPQRYYRILIKTEIGGSSVVLDSGNLFKVVQ